jgi:hypothetical protein
MLAGWLDGLLAAWLERVDGWVEGRQQDVGVGGWAYTARCIYTASEGRRC